MKQSSRECQKNGVRDIVEIKIGYDGLTLAQSKQGPAIKLTLAQLFQALAKRRSGTERQARRQSQQDPGPDIDKSLPTLPKSRSAAADLRHP